MRIIIAALAAVALLVGSCCLWCNKPPREIHTVVTVNGQCLDSDNPPPQPVEWASGVYGKDAGCPAQFGGCLSVDALSAVLGYLGKLIDWSDAAWVRCGPRDAGPN